MTRSKATAVAKLMLVIGLCVAAHLMGAGLALAGEGCSSIDDCEECGELACAGSGGFAYVINFDEQTGECRVQCGEISLDCICIYNP